MSSVPKRLAPTPPTETDADQEDGPLEHVFDVSRLLRPPPALEAAEEQPYDLSGIELRFEFEAELLADEAPLEHDPLAGLVLGSFDSSAESEQETDAADDERARHVALHKFGAALDELPPLEGKDDERHFEPIVLPKNAFLDTDLEEADDQPAFAHERASSGLLQVLGTEGRFRASYCLQQSVSRAALCKDGLLIAGSELALVHADGTVKPLTSLPTPVCQLLSHETEGWAVFSTREGRLYRVTEGAWQPQPLALPRGLIPNSEVQLFTLEDQPKLMASGMLWDLVGRATQIVPDPSVQRVARVSEPSAEYAVCRTASGFNLVHLLHNSSHPSQFDWSNPRTLLSSAGGRLVVLTARGELCLMDRPSDVRQRVLVQEPVLALTMGVVVGEALVWLARQMHDEIELLEIEFGTGLATSLFRHSSRGSDRSAQLLWSVTERVLYLVTPDEVVALKRLEA